MGFVTNRKQKWLRVIYGFLRAVYGWLRVAASGLRYLRIVTSYLRKNQSVHNRQKIFDMSKDLPLLSQFLQVVASCDELFTETSELLRVLAIDYKLAIRKDSL